MFKTDKSVIKILKDGGVGVLPTDTLYGLVGSALNEKAVERIYKLKNRSESKPFIILISNIKDLDLFGVRHMSDTSLTPFWPGPVSIIFDCPSLSKEMSYLRPVNNTLAFRFPNQKWLKNVLKKTGPLVAPTVNPEGLPPAENTEQAKAYFGEAVDFYIGKGELNGQPSTLIKIDENGLEIKRQGRAQITNN